MAENTNNDSNTIVGEQPTSDEHIEVFNATILPKPIKEPKPVYPAKARNSGIKATVIMRILIDEKGVPKEVIVLKCDAKKYHDEFIESAKKAVMKTRWKPAYAGNKPVPAWIAYNIKFEP
ncbi:energy transducer TonB [bacterium]|nr:energy transducer TonB [bacterium]